MNKDEIERAYRYLERIKLAYYNHYGLPQEKYYLHEEDLENFPREYREILENIVWSSDDNFILPTRGEKSFAYQLLKKCVESIDTPAIKEKIVHICGKVKQDELCFPIWGNVSSLDFSAELCLIGSGTKLVMISDAVFISANLWVKIIDSILFKSDDSGLYICNLTYESMSEYLNKNYVIQQRYNDFVGSIIFFKTPVLARQYFDEPSIFRGAMIEGFETFVVAHEYAHSLCGHINKNCSSLNDIDASLNDLGVERICHKWEDEFEADCIGAYITLEAIGYNEFSEFIRFMGIYLCLSLFELEEKINEKILGKVAVSKTHPPGTDRKRRLIENFFPESTNCIYNDIDLILDELWEDFLETFKKIIQTNSEKHGKEIFNLKFDFFQKEIYKDV